MKKILVTGATGHLGRNLVEQLSKENYQIIAAVRSTEKAKSSGLLDSVQVVTADLTNLNDVEHIISGVDIVVHAAANFSHWSPEPQKDIIESNVKMSENVMIAAKKAGVEKVIYVSSIGALARTNNKVVTAYEWNLQTYGNPYFESKVVSERLAWEKAVELGVDMVAVLPGAMVGGPFDHQTPTTKFLAAIKHGELPFDLDFEINLVDVVDACDGIVKAIENGIAGKRYILANEKGISISDINDFFRTRKPKLKRPIKVGKPILMAIASIAECVGFLTKSEPQLLRSQVNFYYKTKENFDISASIEDLSFTPKTSLESLEDNF